ncbi:MAG: hypothetical protein P0S95_05635 [Rhabdochlamydiaceae bacterium]|nr:hypothetical protein [Candidatus Amphrikana amoebophyrae]
MASPVLNIDPLTVRHIEEVEESHLFAGEIEITALVEKMGLSMSQKGDLESYIDCDSGLIKRTEILDPDVYIRNSPTETAMRIYSEHYYEKYGLEIKYCSPEEAMKVITKRKDLGACGRNFAMIVTSPDSPHVVPVYCHYSLEDDQLYVIVMDSIDQTQFPSHFALALAKKPPKGVIALFSEGARQVSNFGCKIDALATLKYTHYVLTHEKVSHIPDFISIETGKIEEWNEERGEDSYIPCQTFKVPSCFVPAAQTLKMVSTDRYDKIVINKKGETIKQLRERYLITRTIQTTVLNSKCVVVVSTKETKALRSYLLMKERKIADKVRSFKKSDHK